MAFILDLEVLDYLGKELEGHRPSCICTLCGIGELLEL